MMKKKIVVETTEVETQKVVETKKVKAEKVESAEKIAYRKLIEVYAKQNPVKYELKKVAMEAKLKEIK